MVFDNYFEKNKYTVDELIRRVKELRNVLDKGNVDYNKSIELLFSIAIKPFVDHPEDEYDSVDTEVGHILYRISDFIPEGQRKTIAIYPFDEGSLTIDDTRWYSLEDFRKFWKSINPIIPEIVKSLPEVKAALQLRC